MNTIYRLMWLIVFLCAFKLAVSGADAHSWYDRDCCSDEDCFPVTKIERKKDGSVFHANGEEIFVSNYYWGLLSRQKRVRVSKDTEFHICYREYKFAKFAQKVAECIYVPGGM